MFISEWISSPGSEVKKRSFRKKKNEDDKCQSAAVKSPAQKNTYGEYNIWEYLFDSIQPWIKDGVMNQQEDSNGNKAARQKKNSEVPEKPQDIEGYSVIHGFGDKSCHSI